MKPAPKTFPYTFVLIFIIVAIIGILCSSCGTQGYGCRGKGKIITRVKQF